MRVLHVQKVSGIGGSERHLLALLPALAVGGVEVRMCTLATGDSHRFTDVLAPRGVDVCELPAGPDANPTLSYRLAAEIKRYRPDVVHTHLIHADLYGQLAARVTGVPGVSSFHGALDFYRREPYRTAARLAGRSARRLIAISEFIGEFLVAGRFSSPDRVRVIPYGIDLAGWALEPPEREHARRELGLGDGEVVLGIASRLIPGKGHDVLVDAVAGAFDEMPSLRLVVAGDGPMRADLERRAEASCPPGRVRFLGYVDDVRRFMGACDVVAMPTLAELSEGFGLAALEAMAAARPVVATTVGSLPEVVADGETGLLVEPGSVGALREAVVRLSRDAGLRAQLGAQAARRAHDVFGLAPMVERTAAVYDEVV